MSVRVRRRSRRRSLPVELVLTTGSSAGVTTAGTHNLDMTDAVAGDVVFLMTAYKSATTTLSPTDYPIAGWTKHNTVGDGSWKFDIYYKTLTNNSAISLTNTSAGLAAAIAVVYRNLKGSSPVVTSTTPVYATTNANFVSVNTLTLPSLSHIALQFMFGYSTASRSISNPTSDFTDQRSAFYTGGGDGFCIGIQSNIAPISTSIGSGTATFSNTVNPRGSYRMGYEMA